ncbi:MAG: hypothetical protein HQ465_16965 [Rhodospirillales bacterium]|nr:hypothetical protein [Rhodospirillales bacterium]
MSNAYFTISTEAGTSPGLLKGMDSLSRWTPAQRDEIDGLAGKIITRRESRPQRTAGKPVGYLYE